MPLSVPTSTRGGYNTLAPAGSTISDAAAVNADVCMLTGGSNNAGVQLQPMDVNQICVVVNGDSDKQYFVYPVTGGKLNNATANLGVNVGPNKAVSFRAINATDCIVMGTN